MSLTIKRPAAPESSLAERGYSDDLAILLRTLRHAGRLRDHRPFTSRRRTDRNYHGSERKNRAYNREAWLSVKPAT